MAEINTDYGIFDKLYDWWTNSNYFGNTPSTLTGQNYTYYNPNPYAGPQGYTNSYNQFAQNANALSLNQNSDYNNVGWGQSLKNTMANVQPFLSAGSNIYGIYNSMQQMKLAKEGLAEAKRQNAFNRYVTQKNLANNVQSYNNRLYDILRARGSFESGDVNKYNDQYNNQKLSM